MVNPGTPVPTLPRDAKGQCEKARREAGLLRSKTAAELVANDAARLGGRLFIGLKRSGFRTWFRTMQNA